MCIDDSDPPYHTATLADVKPFPPPSLLSLPTELIYCIVDYLHDNKQSLKACSQTCHTLSNPTRFHLVGKCPIDAAGGDTFLDILLGEMWGTLPGNVHHLLLGSSGLLIGDQLDREMTTSDIDLLIYGLRNVRKLTVYKVDPWGALPVYFRSLILGLRINHLEICLGYLSTDAVTSLLSMSYTHLTITAREPTLWKQYEGHVTRLLKRPFQFHWLNTLRIYPLSFFLEWVLALDSAPTIKLFSFNIDQDTVSLTTLKRFFSKATIPEVRIHFPQQFLTTGGSLLIPKFALCSALRILRLENVRLSDDLFGQHTSNTAIAVLSQLPSLHLEEVYLTTIWTTKKQFITRGWGNLPALFKSAPLAELRVFSVSLMVLGEQEAVNPVFELYFLENGPFSPLYRRGVFEWKEVVLKIFTDIFKVDGF